MDEMKSSNLQIYTPFDSISSNTNDEVSIDERNAVISEAYSSRKYRFQECSFNDTIFDSVSKIEDIIQFVEVVHATEESTKHVGMLITDCEDIINDSLLSDKGAIRMYSNIEERDRTLQSIVHLNNVRWKDNTEIAWMKRHNEDSQGFLFRGRSPGLVVLGEPTDSREDLPKHERQTPDISRVKAYIVPAGRGIIIKKGTWHHFPMSIGPDVAVFAISLGAVDSAIKGACEATGNDPLNLHEAFSEVKLRFSDPRSMLVPLGIDSTSNSIFVYDEKKDSPNIYNSCETRPDQTYLEDMARVEVGTWGGRFSHNVWVIPIINVEAFNQTEFGPSIQPHLNKTLPEIANKGWRDYGNKQGLKRLGKLFNQYKIPCTAVVSSDLTRNKEVMDQLFYLQQNQGWEIGAHGTNNSSGSHAMLSIVEETKVISSCIRKLQVALKGSKPSTWLTPGFSISNSTWKLLSQAGFETLLDAVDDDKPFILEHKFKCNNRETHQSQASIVCLPYSMETNDFSLVLTRNLSPHQYASALESHILQLAKESAESGSPSVVCLGMHTFIAGTPAAVHELDIMLKRLMNVGNIKWATANEVSRCVKGDDELAFVAVTETPSFSVTDTISKGSKGNSASITARPSSIEANRNNLGLILIDFQHDFMSPNGFGEILGNKSSKLQHIIEPTKSVLSCFRSLGLTVVHTREGHRTNLADLTPLKTRVCASIGQKNECGRLMVRGEWGNEIICELRPLLDGSETVIDKPGKSAFYQTDLELVLKNANIDTLVVCGVTTEVCVHSTVREANDRGIKCIVLEDCTASYFEHFHTVAIDMIAAQGGIFGSISDSKSVISALSELK